jgi:hypothetical protein
MSTNDRAGIAGTRYASGAEALQALVDARRKHRAAGELIERASAILSALNKAQRDAEYAERDAFIALGAIAEHAPEHLRLAPSPNLEARIVAYEDMLNGIEHQAASIAAEAWRQEGD